jgi:hypothetical protein
METDPVPKRCVFYLFRFLDDGQSPQTLRVWNLGFNKPLGIGSSGHKTWVHLSFRRNMASYQEIQINMAQVGRAIALQTRAWSVLGSNVSREKVYSEGAMVSIPTENCR